MSLHLQGKGISRFSVRLGRRRTRRLACLSRRDTVRACSRERRGWPKRLTNSNLRHDRVWVRGRFRLPGRAGQVRNSPRHRLPLPFDRPNCAPQQLRSRRSAFARNGVQLGCGDRLATALDVLNKIVPPPKPAAQFSLTQAGQFARTGQCLRDRAIQSRVSSHSASFLGRSKYPSRPFARKSLADVG